MTEIEYAVAINEAKTKLELLEKRLDSLESEVDSLLPDSKLFDESFLNRSAAIFGHWAVTAIFVFGPTIYFFFFR